MGYRVGVGRIRRGSTAVVVVFALVLVAVASPAAAQRHRVGHADDRRATSVQWDPGRLDVEVPAGASVTVTADLRVDGAVDAASFSTNGPLANVARVTAPTDGVDLGEGAHQVELAIDVSAGAESGDRVGGTLRLRSGQRPVGRPLPVTVTVVEAESGDGLRWERLGHDAVGTNLGVGDQLMASVTVGGPGLVAVGNENDGEAATVWVSSGGTAWERIEHAPLFGVGAPLEEHWMRAVTAAGPGLVAVGAVEGDAAVWVSADGYRWERVADDDGALNGGSSFDMWAVTEGGRGLVAVGTAGGAAAAWTSTDGLDWRRVAHDEAVFGGDGRQRMTTVVAGGSGLVATGADDGAPAIWRSEDGEEWERVALDGTVFGGSDVRLHGLASGGSGFVAVGRADGAAAAWVSGDGANWARADDGALAEGGALHAVTVAAPGFVAVGADAAGHPAVWQSADGSRWERVPYEPTVLDDEPSDGQMLDVTAGGPGLVAVGWSFIRPAVWVAR
jgi:hypothetical protein